MKPAALGRFLTAVKRHFLLQIWYINHLARIIQFARYVFTKVNLMRIALITNDSDTTREKCACLSQIIRRVI